MVRRFIYDTRLKAVVEVEPRIGLPIQPLASYQDAEGGWRQRQDESTGKGLRNAALERAERRVFAHKRYGDEGRWTE